MVSISVDQQRTMETLHLSKKLWKPCIYIYLVALRAIPPPCLAMFGSIESIGSSVSSVSSALSVLRVMSAVRVMSAMSAMRVMRVTPALKLVAPSAPDSWSSRYIYSYIYSYIYIYIYIFIYIFIYIQI